MRKRWMTLVVVVTLLVTATGMLAASASAVPAAQPGQGSKAVGFIFVGPKDDFGYNQAAFEGSQAVKKAFPNLKVLTAENVPEDDTAARVMEGMIDRGAKIIFATSYGHLDAALKVAAAHPDVVVVQQGNFIKGSIAPNAGTFFGTVYEPVYLAGIAAGKATKTNKLGYVYAFPIPQTIDNIDAFQLGAQSVNPKVKTKVVWVNEWFNPPKETEAAQSLINGGADVLMQNTDSSAVLQTAGKAGKYAFGWDSDMKAYSPDAHLASAIINWAPYYKKATQEALDGTWKGGGHTWWGVKEGAIDIVSISDKVPADVKAKVEAAKAGLKDGSFVIWKGPITSNDGKEVLAAGTNADDKFLGGINFFVKGVEGKVPGADKK